MRLSVKCKRLDAGAHAVLNSTREKKESFPVLVSNTVGINCIAKIEIIDVSQNPLQTNKHLVSIWSYYA